MEQNKDLMQMLELMISPAFCVKDGIIISVNAAAAQQMIPVGSPVARLLMTGQQEYAEFQEGCLYLTLHVGGARCGASVTRIGGFDAFVLEQDADQAELQAMALAAKELRNPLSNMLSVADNLFPMPCLSENSEATELASRINRGLFQMNRIICNMSDAYRYSQEAAPQMETRDICSLLEEQFSQNAELFRTIGIDLNYTGLRETVYGLVDSEKLERAVHNILSNAGKYTPAGGTIDAKLTRRGAMLYLTVHDSGSGIPDELLSSVYRRYTRQPGIEEGRHGIGLGMVIIRSVAAIHGGTVLIERSTDHGTRLTMTIAIRQNTDGSVRSPILRVDYAGERDHRLIELSESLPAELYLKDMP